MNSTNSSAHVTLLTWERDEGADAPAPRIDRGRVLLETLAAEGCLMSARDAKNLLRQCIDNLAAHVGVTRSHLVRHYITEQWVRTFALNIAQVARAHQPKAASPATGAVKHDDAN